MQKKEEKKIESLSKKKGKRKARKSWSLVANGR
jgi:hypothetical protein